MKEWHIGYAPGGWTALTSYLRGRGHHDDTIQAAGLARISSRGTLIDHFRDRVMLPVHDENGALAGFIGRARPGTGPDIPKYLNGPATSTYHKGDLLFGLHQARARLARGATPVIAEGPFDAIAVTLADPRHYAGLAAVLPARPSVTRTAQIPPGNFPGLARPVSSPRTLAPSSSTPMALRIAKAGAAGPVAAARFTCHSPRASPMHRADGCRTRRRLPS
jgi:DNA primase catalytic core, N-terminal domain